MMRAVPRQVGSLDEGGFDADHFAIVVVRSIFGRPLSVVPLADESSPVLNVQLDGGAAYLERRLLIAISRSREHVQPVVGACRQINCLSFRDYCIARARSCRSELEFDIAEFNLRRQHFSG